MNKESNNNKNNKDYEIGYKDGYEDALCGPEGYSWLFYNSRIYRDGYYAGKAAGAKKLRILEKEEKTKGSRR